MPAVTDLLVWTPWRPLLTASPDSAIPRVSGLYRIVRMGRNAVNDIGQTSLRLGQRLAMLRGVYADEMPYRDTATRTR